MANFEGPRAREHGSRKTIENVYEGRLGSEKRSVEETDITVASC